MRSDSGAVQQRSGSGLGTQLVTRKQGVIKAIVDVGGGAAKTTDSVLAGLSQRDFDAGMSLLRAHAALSDGEAVFEPIDVSFFDRYAATDDYLY